MDMTSAPAATTSASFLDSVFSTTLGLMGRVLLLVMVCWLALLGLALGGLLLVWSLLRGRRPTLRFRFGTPSMDWQRFRRGSASASAPAGDRPQRTPGDVIEGQAREIR